MAQVNERVFCNKCDWYGKKSQRCKYPSNITEEVTWLKVVKIPTLHPSKKNKINNCPDYSPRKWWRLLWRG